MGGWFVATALGTYLAGAIGVLWTSWAHSSFFFLLVGTSLLAATILAVCLPILEAAVASVAPPVTVKEGVLGEMAMEPPGTAMALNEKK